MTDRELGAALTQFPCQFMEPVFIGDPPLLNVRPTCATGTATLLHLGGNYLAVTCFHVLHAYRLILNRPRHFQIGHAAFDPELQLLSEDKRLDVAIIQIRADQLLDERTGLGIPETRFFRPHRWPPDGFEEDDVVSFAGFPGEWREQSGLLDFYAYTFSHGASFVHSVNGTRFVTRLESERAEKPPGTRDLTNPAGMSGGPVFRWRRRSLAPELVGIIFEYQQTFDLLFARSTSVILEDGQLDHGAL